jgi:hypothetical protein
LQAQSPDQPTKTGGAPPDAGLRSEVLGHKGWFWASRRKNKKNLQKYLALFLSIHFATRAAIGSTPPVAGITGYSKRGLFGYSLYQLHSKLLLTGGAIMKKLFCALVLASLLFVPRAYADLEQGVVAYERGDYETALREFSLLAEQGDADAQIGLGILYSEGKGVPQDNSEAARWYRKAAEQGHADAQMMLGGMYLFGQGVSQDYVLAYMWIDLAAAQDNEYAPEVRDNLSQLMTAEQISEAHRLGRGHYRADLRLLPAAAAPPQASQIDQHAGALQSGDQTAHPYRARVPERRKLPAPDPGARRRDP